MSDMAELVPTQEDLELIRRLLDAQDILEALGKCSDYPDGEGNCRLCTAMQRLDMLIQLMSDEDAWIGTK